MAKFVIRKNESSQYWFVLKSDNNKIVLQSQMYTTKQHAENGIRAIKDEAQDASVDDRTGEHYHMHEPVEHYSQQP
ncbi:MAG: DUF1508 domain-containing protein [Candidatus Obscuribacterales bacterium]|nr:DUF1508 domain-containing protein [Candidatus Obscuribacterales bacterium]